MKTFRCSSAATTAIAALLLGLATVSPTSAQCTLTGFEGFSTAPNGFYLFRRPNFSGSTLFLLDASYPDSSRATTERAHTGVNSLKVQWKFGSFVSGPRWLRLTTFQSGAVSAVLPNPAIGMVQAISFWIYVPAGTPDFYLTACVRETGTTAGCGGNGGVSGALEWVGAASSRGPVAAPIGRLIDAKDQWVQVVLELPCEPIMSFVLGNATLNGARGVFEHLAFTPVNDTDLGPYTIYLDDFSFDSVEPPHVTCPNDFEVECNAQNGGLHGAYVNFPSPTVDFHCDATPAVTFTPPSGSFLALGEHTVNCTVSHNGLSDSCSFTVNVVDRTAPTFSDNVTPLIDACDPSTPVILTNDTGRCEARYVFAAPTAEDDCADVVLVTLTAVDQLGGTVALADNGDGTMTGVFPVGTNVVTTVADDGHGNTAQAQCTIIVRDAEAPAIVCPANQVVVGDCGGVAHWAVATFSDNCAVATHTATHSPGDSIGPGITTVTTTVTDISGNSSSCDFTVEVLSPVPDVQFLAPLVEGVANRFSVGQTIPVKVRLADCSTNPVIAGVTVKLDVKGLESDGLTVFHDVDEQASGLGEDMGDTMALVDQHFQFNLKTTGYVSGTSGNGRYYRLRVTVWDNAKTVKLGEDSVTLESQ